MENLGSAPWLRRAIVAAMIAGLFLLGFNVLQPFIVPAIWAGILTYVTWSLNLRVARWCGGRRTLAALITTLLLTAAVIIPTASVVLLLRTEVASAYHDIVAALSDGRGLPPLLLKLPVVGPWLQDLNARMVSDPQALRDTLTTAFNSSYGRITNVLGDVGRNIAKLLITIISLFFFYRDGDHLAGQIRGVLEKILGARVHDYLDAAGQTVKAVLISLVLCALAQGILAGLGYWVAGVKAPVFAAAVTTLAALIPFAVPVVWGSIVVWMFATGQTIAAIGLLLWCVGVVSWIDNLIRPLVISNQTRIPFLLVMFGVLGGLGAFGLVGLFVGPVILAVLLSIWREWLSERPVAGSVERQD
jgi:predicted PurR-regulated permease PerM